MPTIGRKNKRLHSGAWLLCHFCAGLASAVMLLVSLSSFCAARPRICLSQIPVQLARAQTPSPEVVRVNPNTVLDGNLAGGQRLTFALELAKGEYAKIPIEQRGIDFLVRLRTPDGRVLSEIDQELRLTGTETVEVVAPTAGMYTIEIEGKFKWLPAGRYQIRVTEKRPADEKDRILEEARRLDQQRRELLAALAPVWSQDPALAGKLGEALPLAERCLDIYTRELGPERYLVASAIENLASIYSAMGNTDKAEPLIKQAIALYEKIEGTNHPAVARSLNVLGLVLLHKGNYSAGEAALERSLNISETVLGPSDPNAAWPLMNLGIIYWTNGDYRKAESYYSRAAALREAALGPDSTLTADAKANLGAVFMELGELEKAEPLIKYALSVAERANGLGDPKVARLLTNLGLLYRTKGDYIQAEQFFRRAKSIYEKVLGPADFRVGQELEYLGGVNRLKGDYTAAEPLYRQALEIEEKALGPDDAKVGLVAGNLANALADMGGLVEAETLYNRALAIAEKAYGPEHPDVAFALNNLGSLYIERREFSKAEAALSQAVRIREKSLGSEHPYLQQSLDALARLCVAEGRFTEAVAYQARANSIGEYNLALNLAIGSERQKLAYLDLAGAQEFSQAAQLSIALQTVYAPDDPAALTLALTLQLQRKGRVLDALSRSMAALRQHLTPQDEGLLEASNQTTARLAGLVFNGPQNGSLAGHETEIRTLEQKRDQLESELSQRSAGFYQASPKVTIDAILRAIPSNTALIEFAVYTQQDVTAHPGPKSSGPLRFVAYVLRGDGQVRWKDLGEAKPLNEAVELFRRALRDPKRRDAAELGRALDEKLMQPLRPLLGEASQLLISPDGDLSLIPFEALVDENNHYLVERYSISYLGSGRDLLRLEAAGIASSNPIIVADPWFGVPETVTSKEAQKGGQLAKAPNRPTGGAAHSDGGKRQSVTTGGDMSRLYFAPLSATEREAKDIQDLFPDATIWTGAQATKTALKGVKAPRILHIATHGFFIQDTASAGAGSSRATRGYSTDAAADNPLLRSGLALAGANLRNGDATDNGILTALEASALDLWGTKLVVLSACDTGIGEVRTGEGVYGLRRAFVQAGAETLVMSLWPVNDHVTRELMTRYYERLKRGGGRAEALRQVQLEMLKRKDRRHPFYWASFIASGEWANMEGKH
jgi:CHAT domain-containing protein/Tfp pilus assembly protein PilF